MGAWIEILKLTKPATRLPMSHPTMGAWIEIKEIEVLRLMVLVAPHDGCVDWNNLMWIY